MVIIYEYVYMQIYISIWRCSERESQEIECFSPSLDDFSVAPSSMPLLLSMGIYLFE